MQRLLFITLFFVLVSSFCFSADGAGDRTGHKDYAEGDRLGEKENGCGNYTFSFRSDYRPGKIELYKSGDVVAGLAKHEQTFLALAIGFTIGTGASLVIGIIGSVLYGVGFLTGDLPLMIPGYVLMGLGWGHFVLCLIAAITFWILYAVPKVAGKEAKLMEKLKKSPVLVDASFDRISITIRL